MPAEAFMHSGTACTHFHSSCPPHNLQVRKGLGHIDPYFTKLADGMIAWIQGWQMLNPPTKAA